MLYAVPGEGGHEGNRRWSADGVGCMTTAGLASAVLACLPAGVMEQILDIWEAQADRHVEMDFRHGRCLRIKITDTQQFTLDDFEETV